MKYIRTKDGIYEVDVLSIHYIGETHFSCWDIKHTRAFNDWHIIKQANNIEELCDEFVVVSDNCEKPIISALPFNELQLYAKGRTKYAICYGAIWCEWGLKYVARMNSDGVLELL